MNVVAFVLLMAAPGADPLPDNKVPIDSLAYRFGDGVFGARGTLSIGRDGKVAYSHATAPHTGSGGQITTKEWELTRDEMKELFAKVVAAGLPSGDELNGGIWATGGAQSRPGGGGRPSRFRIRFRGSCARCWRRRTRNCGPRWRPRRGR